MVNLEVTPPPPKNHKFNKYGFQQTLYLQRIYANKLLLLCLN